MGDFQITEKSLNFIKNCFSKYYKNSNIELPDRFTRREFAFILFEGRGMIRHIGFEKKALFNEFLRQKIPAHIYYSSAYYQKPDAPSMQEKVWMGAELIFDLDSDHLPNTDKLSYTEQLNLVKKEFSKLVNDFLLNDFGFNEKYIKLYFSGSRGYHCHVNDPAVLTLDSNERREIVDYITGRDLKESLVFQELVTDKKRYGRKEYAIRKTLTMPKPDEPGWRGRISRGIIDIIYEIKKSDNPVEKLRDYGVKRSDAEKLVEELSDYRIERIKEGRLDQSKTIRKFFLNSAIRRTAVTMVAGETDEPVTCDTKRLIRLPGSLHGKTGFRVEKIEINELKDFDPLRDAVALPDDPVKIDLKERVSIRMKDEDFNLEIGEQEVPTFLAVFLINRNMANVI